jgi:hypothetical protein
VFSTQNKGWPISYFIGVVGASVALLIVEETRKNNKDATSLAEYVFNSEQRPPNFLLLRDLGSLCLAISG